MPEGKKRTRGDSQITGMAGEFLVAGKLFKRGFQVSVIMGNAKSIDLFVHNPKTHHTFNVQVKTLRHKNCFQIGKESIYNKYIYVFVFLHHIDEDEEFFMLSGETILSNLEHFFGSSYRKQPSIRPAINYGPLKKFKNKWEIFD